MRLTNVLSLVVLAFSLDVGARSEADDFGNIPYDQVLFQKGDGIPVRALEKRQGTSTSRVADSACTNSPTTRNCWSSGYSIATDFDAKWPTTGVTRNYQLTITNTTCNPDGNGARICLLFNNQYPGPVITANWGDYLSITVTNNMPSNGTSIHWHGIRQLGTNAMDGVNGLTECPLAPGQSQTFNFQATQFGTTWYHSHYSSQYGDGLVGTMVINGPAAANYDIDLGPFPVSDWYYQTSFQVSSLTNQALQRAQPGPPGDNILINGTNMNAAKTTGQYLKTTVASGKKYRLRIVNTSVDNAIRFSIDNHQLQVITADFVPVQSVMVNSVLLGIGQRYDVIVFANQTIGNYWMRASVENACASSNNGAGYGILSYPGAPLGNPTTTSTAASNGCNPPGTLVPWVPNTVGNQTAFIEQAHNLQTNLYLPGTTSNNQNIVVWGINMSAIDVSWSMPTLSYVAQGNTSYPSTYNLIELPTEGQWVYWIIQETMGGVVNIPHPIHLHGHDFYIMGTGTGQFNLSSDPQKLTYNNPTRRDTAFLPGGGWLVIAFPTDNPGAWLMHCHIAWHISEGLGLQFLEAKSQINLPGASYTNQCNAFDSYYKGAYWKKDDSGL